MTKTRKQRPNLNHLTAALLAVMGCGQAHAFTSIDAGAGFETINSAGPVNTLTITATAGTTVNSDLSLQGQTPFGQAVSLKSQSGDAKVYLQDSKINGQAVGGFGVVSGINSGTVNTLVFDNTGLQVTNNSTTTANNITGTTSLQSSNGGTNLTIDNSGLTVAGNSAGGVNLSTSAAGSKAQGSLTATSTAASVLVTSDKGTTTGVTVTSKGTAIAGNTAVGGDLAVQGQTQNGQALSVKSASGDTKLYVQDSNVGGQSVGGFGVVSGINSGNLNTLVFDNTGLQVTNNSTTTANNIAGTTTLQSSNGGTSLTIDNSGLTVSGNSAGGVNLSANVAGSLAQGSLTATGSTASVLVTSDKGTTTGVTVTGKGTAVGGDLAVQGQTQNGQALSVKSASGDTKLYVQDSNVGGQSVGGFGVVSGINSGNLNTLVFDNTGLQVTNNSATTANNIAGTTTLQSGNGGTSLTIDNSGLKVSGNSAGGVSLSTGVAGSKAQGAVNATGTTASVLVTNEQGNVHGLTVGASATTLSGGVNSTVQTLNDTAVTYTNGTQGGTLATVNAGTVNIGGASDIGGAGVGSATAGTLNVNGANGTSVFSVNGTTGDVTATGTVNSNKLSAGAGGLTVTGAANLNGGIQTNNAAINAGSGSISTTGTVSGGSLTGNSLTAGAGGLSSAGVANLNGGIQTNNASINAGSGSISTTGTVSGGSVTGNSVTAGAGGLSSAGMAKLNGGMTVVGVSNSVTGTTTLQSSNDAGANALVVGATKTETIAGSAMSYGTAVTGGLKVDGDLGVTGAIHASNAGTGTALVAGNNIVYVNNSSAGISVVNPQGNAHGIVVTGTETVISGGTSSTSLTLNDDGATFRNTATGGGPVRVTGVANGVNAYDAVNKSQLDQVNTNLNTRIDGVNNRINHLQDRVYGGIAGVAAMASIPAPRAGHNYSIGIGYGNFGNQNAMAFGGKANIADNFQVAANLGYGSSNLSVGVGAGFSW